MTNSIITDKISKSIMNLIKKTNFFKKIEKIDIYIWSFVAISSFYGISNIIMSQYYYYNSYNQTAELKYLIIQNNKSIEAHICSLENKITNLENKLLESHKDKLLYL